MPVSDDASCAPTSLLATLSGAAAFNAAPASYWDALYSNTRDTMYKDRSWLCAEFPEVRRRSRWLD